MKDAFFFALRNRNELTVDSNPPFFLCVHGLLLFHKVFAQSTRFVLIDSTNTSVKFKWNISLSFFPGLKF